MASLWAWLGKNAPAIGVVFVVVAGGWVLFTFVLSRSTGDVVDVAAIVDKAIEVARQEGKLAAELEGAQTEIQDLREQLEAAVQALADELNDPDAPAGIDDALASLGEEVEKVLQNELGEDVHPPEGGRPAAPDRALVMHI